MSGLRKIRIPVILIVTILFASALGCNREPVQPPMPVIEQISINDLKSLYTGSDVLVDTNVYIQGIVTMTPELNNIPDFVAYMQDTSGAVTLTITGNNTLSSGSEIKIYCQGLTLTKYHGLIQFGDVDLATQSELITLDGEMPELKEVTLQDVLDKKYIAELVTIPATQFVEGGTFSGSKTLTDCTNEVEVYTRSAATFSGDPLPTGNGTFKGIISVYDSPQLMVREPSELVMEDSRCGPISSDYLNETFESLANYADIISLAGWTNPFEAGDRTWIARIYSNNVYAQASAFGSALPSMISWLITPMMDLTTSTAPALTFDSKGGYDNGATLEVLISTDYDGGGSPWNFTWTDLNPVLDNPPTDGYSANFQSSGVIDLSAYKGHAYIAFKYTGADPSATTTWQIDNVLVAETDK